MERKNTNNSLSLARHHVSTSKNCVDCLDCVDTIDHHFNFHPVVCSYSVELVEGEDFSATREGKQAPFFAIGATFHTKAKY